MNIKIIVSVLAVLAFVILFAAGNGIAGGGCPPGFTGPNCDVPIDNGAVQVPEPGTLILLASGAVGLAGLAFRLRKKR